FINLSLQLNDLPFIQSLILENTGESDVAAIELRITSDLPLLEPFCQRLSLLPAGKEVKIPLGGLAVSRAFLASISESERVKIRMEVLAEGQSGSAEERIVSVHPLE